MLSSGLLFLVRLGALKMKLPLASNQTELNSVILHKVSLPRCTTVLISDRQKR